jgi:hypothetical protein
MSILVYNAIFWLQISVDDVLLVKVLKSQDNLHSIKFDPPPLKAVFLAELQVLCVVDDPEHVLPWHVVKEVSNRVYIHESVFKIYDKWTLLGFVEKFLFIFSMFYPLIVV